MLDLNYWKVIRSHTWLDDTSLYLLRRDDLFAIVIISADDMILDTFTTFDNKNASLTYNNWKAKLMKNRTEWYEEI